MFITIRELLGTKKKEKKNSFYEKINFVVRNLQQGYLMQMELGYNSFEQQDKY
jgi:hypothetical protein